MWAQAYLGSRISTFSLARKSPVCSLGTTKTSGKIDQFAREPSAPGIDLVCVGSPCCWMINQAAASECWCSRMKCRPRSLLQCARFAMQMLAGLVLSCCKWRLQPCLCSCTSGTIALIRPTRMLITPSFSRWGCPNGPDHRFPCSNLGEDWPGQPKPSLLHPLGLTCFKPKDCII